MAEKAHVSEAKKSTVRELGNLMKKKTVMIISISGLPSSHFQSIRKKLRSKAIIKSAKKSLINLALKNSKIPELEKLAGSIKEDCVIIFSDEDAFELSALMSENKSPAKAKSGQIASEDIVIEPGPTDLVPGPDISALSAVGLRVKVEGGKLAIQEKHVLVKKGEKISEQKAVILSKLGITPFSVGLEPLAAFCDGKLYLSVKVDKEKTLEDLKEKFGKALAFAVSLDYPSTETVMYLLAKAAGHEKAIQALLGEKNE